MRAPHLFLLGLLLVTARAAVPVVSGTVPVAVGVTLASSSAADDYSGGDPDLLNTVFYWSGTTTTPEFNAATAGLNNPVGATMGYYGSAAVAANTYDSNNLWLHLPGDGNYPAMQFYHESNSPAYGYLQSGKTRTRLSMMFHGAWAANAVIHFWNGKVPSTTSKYYANAWGAQIGTTTVSSVPSINGAGVATYAMVQNTEYLIEQRLERVFVNSNNRRLGRTYIKNAAGTVLAAGYTTTATTSGNAPTTANHMGLWGNDTTVVLDLYLRRMRVQTSYPFDLTIPNPADWHNMEQASIAACGFTEMVGGVATSSGSRFSLVTDSSMRSGVTIDLVADTGTQILRYSANGTTQNSVKKYMNMTGNPAGVGSRVRFSGSMTSGTQNEIAYSTDSVSEIRNIIKLIIKNVAGEYRLYLNNSGTGDSSTYVVVSVDGSTVYDLTMWIKKGAVNNYLIVKNASTGALIGKITHASTGTNPRDFYWFAKGCTTTQTANSLTVDWDNLVTDVTLPEPTDSDPLALNFAAGQL